MQYSGYWVCDCLILVCFALCPNLSTISIQIEMLVQSPIRHPLILSLTLMITLVSLLLTIFLRGPLYLAGINMIYRMQQSGIPLTVTLANICGVIANSDSFIGILVVKYFMTKRKMLALVHILYILIVNALINLLKHSMQDLRPIWSSTQVLHLDWKCREDYGNPSGHCVFFILTFEPIIIESLQMPRKYLFFIPILLIQFCMPFARMYVGSHSVDQVLLGTFLGFSFLVVYRYWAQKQLYSLLGKLVLHTNRLPHNIGIVLTHLMSILIPLFIYYLHFHHQIKLTDRPADKCHTMAAAKQVENKEFMCAAITTVGFGILYALYALSTLNYGQDSRDVQFLVGKWNYRSVGEGALFIIIQVISWGCPLTIIILSDHRFHSVVAKFILRAVLLFITPFLGLMLPRYIDRKWSLIQYASQGKEAAKKIVGGEVNIVE